MDELFFENQHDFKCGHCKEKFSNIDNLKSHMLSIHSKVKNLCDANDTTFEKATTLEKQTLDILKPIPEKDTVRKSFRCEICKMEFVAKSCLKGHVFAVHAQ